MNIRDAREAIARASGRAPCFECGELPGTTGAIVFLLMNGAISEADLQMAFAADIPAWGDEV